MNKELNIEDIDIDKILDFIADPNSCYGCPATERCSTDICYMQIKKQIERKVANDRTNNITRI